MRAWRGAAIGLLAAAVAGGVGAPAARAADAPAAAQAAAGDGLRVVADAIPYGPRRRAQMARYSRRHYGTRRWRLRPRVIVLHYTAAVPLSAVWNTFAANAPNRGERPGVCAHYVVGQHGAVRRLVRATIRCRHTIGLNHRAIGIEFVQRAGRGPHWADRQILGRRAQIRPGLRLVRRLQRRFDIARRDVIGHAMADGHRMFRDREGWRNDHVDWLRRDVREFRRRLAHLP